MRDTFYISVLLLIFIILFVLFVYYLWFIRIDILNKKLKSYFEGCKLLKVKKVTDKSNYIGIQAASITDPIQYQNIEIFIMHFGIAGTFRKKIYLVITFDDAISPSGMYGRGHIFREVTDKISNIKTFKAFEYKVPNDIKYPLINYEAVEVNNGKAFLFFPVASAIGYGGITKVMKQIMK